MMPNLTLEDLPNSSILMAFLSPELVYQKTVTTYAVGALGVCVIFPICPSDNHGILSHTSVWIGKWQQGPNSTPPWVYIFGQVLKFVSIDHILSWIKYRLSTLLYVLTNVIFESLSMFWNNINSEISDRFVIVAPIQKCTAFMRISCVTYHVALSLTAFFFPLHLGSF